MIVAGEKPSRKRSSALEDVQEVIGKRLSQNVAVIITGHPVPEPVSAGVPDDSLLYYWLGPSNTLMRAKGE